MSRSPLGSDLDPGSDYLDGFRELSDRIRAGASFSGRERNCAFLNAGGQSFADASAALGLDLEQDSRGIAFCDWDHDGDVDLWMTNRTAPRLQLLQNQRASAGRKSVAFLLVGDPAQHCPRDAAGARVAVGVGGKARTQTVHLGDGFASQSSRWQAFGLGESDTITSVEVHWPGGQIERFDGASAGGRFVLKQGEGMAERDVTADPGLLEAGALQLPEPTESARIWLSEPAALPTSGALADLPDGPVLLNLWASWCAPCLAELKAFGGATGLPVVPLNVENADGKPNVTAEKAEVVLRSAGIRGGGRLADGALIDALNEIVRERIYRHHNLPLPASFLLDANHRVRAIYKGSVDVATVRADLERLGQPEGERPDRSVPFPGRWSAGLFRSDPVAVASAYQEGGYHDDARAYLRKSLGSIAGDDPLAKLRQADLYMKLGEIDRLGNLPAPAVENFRQAVAANPKLVPARIFLALSLGDLGRTAEALQVVAGLKGAAPGDPNFLNLEADVRRAVGQDAAAVAAYRAVLAANARYIPAIHALASLLATSADAAVRDGTEAVKLAEFLAGAPGARDNVSFVTTLADAYAEAGQFDAATAAALRALELVQRYGDDAAIRLQQARVDQFQNHQPYHATAEK